MGIILPADDLAAARLRPNVFLELLERSRSKGNEIKSAEED